MIICDAHVHVYPCYDVGILIKEAVKNMALAAKNLLLNSGLANLDFAICLTERRDCHFFAETLSRVGQVGELFSVKRVWPGKCALVELPRECATLSDESEIGGLESIRFLYVFAGRQIVTKEGLEILCLLSDASIVDGLSFAETKNAISEVGGLCVINWAPGKWWFRRGKLVESLLDQLIPSQEAEPSILPNVFLGDTTLRPHWWRVPRQMRTAQARRIPIVAGSDPLPFPGEEKLVGTYGLLLDGQMDEGSPVSSMYSSLLACRENDQGGCVIQKGGAIPHTFGKRDDLCRFVMRQLRLRL